MLNWIEGFIYPQLMNKAFHNNDDLYLYLILQVASAFAALVHLMNLILLYCLDLKFLAAVNILSILVYAANYKILVSKKAYLFCGIVIALEVCLYTLLTSYCIGSDNYVILFLFVALVMQATITYSKTWVRVFAALAIWASAICVILIEERFGSLWQIDANLRYILIAFHLHVGIIGIVLELSIGNYIQKAIARYNEIGMQALQSQANTDPLTGLFNRRYAESIFPGLAKEAGWRKFCIAMLDIDDFKKVNDTYGHGVGDEVLKHLARIVRGDLRKSDLVFRWGGEEFLILLDGVTLEDAFNTLEKLRVLIAESEVMAGETSIKVTVTIGAAKFDPSEPGASINLCDRKMYEGKRRGKNRTVI